MADKTMSEDQMVDIVRNALLVAGHEMGQEGDHWPVINDTVYKIMKDFEDVKIEKNVIAEVKKNYELMLQQLIKLRNETSEEEKGELESTITELRALYRACFDEVQNEFISLNDAELPEHIKRAEAIIDTLEEEYVTNR